MEINVIVIIYSSCSYNSPSFSRSSSSFIWFPCMECFDGVCMCTIDYNLINRIFKFNFLFPFYLEFGFGFINTISTASAAFVHDVNRSINCYSKKKCEFVYKIKSNQVTVGNLFYTTTTIR